MKWAAMIRRSAVVCWMVPQLAGCTSWRLETVTPAELIARDHPGRVRVRGHDGRREVFYHPEVRGDSLWGRRQGAAPRADRVMALGDVTAVATSHVSVVKTAALGLGIAAAGAILIGAAMLQGPFDNWGQ